MEKSNVFGRNESLVLNSNTFQKIKQAHFENEMTIKGAVNKTAILLTIVVISAGGSWLVLRNQEGTRVIIWTVLAFLGTMIAAAITAAKMELAPRTAPLYAIFEGSLLGFISGIFEFEYPGIVIKAVLLTCGTLFGLLIIYRVSGYHVTARFRVGVVSSTMAILLVYMADATLHLFGISGIPFLHQMGLIGIGFSLFVVTIAALNLVLDFDLIEKGVRSGAPKYMEWYCAFGVMVTLIWLYLEILKLLAKLAANSDDH